MFNILEKDIVTKEFIIDFLPEYFHGAMAQVQSIANGQVTYSAQLNDDTLLFSFHLEEGEVENAIYLYRDDLVEELVGQTFKSISVISHPDSDCMKGIYAIGKPKKHCVYIRFYVNISSGSVAYQHGLCLGSEYIYQFSVDPGIPCHHTIKIDTDLDVFKKEDARRAVANSLFSDFGEYSTSIHDGSERIDGPFYHFKAGSRVSDVHQWFENKFGLIVGTDLIVQ